MFLSWADSIHMYVPSAPHDRPDHSAPVFLARFFISVGTAVVKRCPICEIPAGVVIA